MYVPRLPKLKGVARGLPGQTLHNLQGGLRYPIHQHIDQRYVSKMGLLLESIPSPEEQPGAKQRRALGGLDIGKIFRAFALLQADKAHSGWRFVNLRYSENPEWFDEEACACSLGAEGRPRALRSQ